MIAYTQKPGVRTQNRSSILSRSKVTKLLLEVNLDLLQHRHPVLGHLFNLRLPQIILSLLKSHSLTLSLSHSVTLSHSHSLTLSFTHSQHAEQLLFSCLCSKITLSLSHSHTLALSHFHTLSMSHSITLDMLNKFCFYVYAHKSLFIAENCNGFFYLSHITLSCYIRCHRAGSQLKMIFTSPSLVLTWCLFGFTNGFQQKPALLLVFLFAFAVNSQQEGSQ